MCGERNGGHGGQMLHINPSGSGKSQPPRVSCAQPNLRYGVIFLARKQCSPSASDHSGLAGAQPEHLWICAAGRCSHRPCPWSSASVEDDDRAHLATCEKALTQMCV